MSEKTIDLNPRIKANYIMECPLCSNLKTREYIKLKEKLYHYCVECDLVFLDESNWLSHEDEKKRYLFHNNTETNPGYLAYLNQFIDFIEPEFEFSSKILDFGCGPNPLLAKLLSKKSYAVDFYDPYFYAELKWQQKIYDIILVHEVIEHLSFPKLVFNQWHKILKQGGAIMIRTAFHPRNIPDFKTWWYIQDSTHIVFYSANSFKILENRGLWQIAKTNNKSMIILKKN